ncbi:hypothetical protein D6745_05290 [Candidatus Woesearchaeota archaeon]|nr:MAG: hypothetical protein D6745_05290 [Candidatus Woesearchaeota archaeon]
MIELVYSPRWFYGKDIAIDLISIFVLSLIAFFSIKYYRLNRKNKKYIFLASSFIMMALSFMFKIITNFTIYYHVLETKQIGFVRLTYFSTQPSNILFFAGFLGYRILMLLGLYMLCSIYIKQSKANIILTAYLILALSYFSRSAYYIFHLTALILLVIITSKYLENYKKTKHSTNKWLFYSFATITASNIIFIFVKISAVLYVIAEIVQLIGYVGLLITFTKVLKDGKKKGKK